MNHEHEHGMQMQQAKTNNHEESPEDNEMRMWKRKLLGSWILSIPIAIIMLSERLFGFSIIPEKATTITLLIIGFPVVFFFGWDTIKSGFYGLSTLYFNMDSLIALGTVIAYLSGIFSFFNFVLDYSGISAMIMAFFITGKYVEAKARGRAGQEIRKLLELGAKKSRVLRNKKEIEIPIEEVRVGDVMIIKPGERIPTDGIVIKGESAIDESMVTGESLPVEKKVKSNVIGATINQDGVLYVKATKIGKDTFLAHIIELVEEAQGTKVPIQKMADKITSYFVPSVIIIAVLTAIGWILITKDISRAIGVSIAVLVVACPCALGLATPTALMVGSGIGAQRGILIRKGEAIQTMKEIKIIVFDKTGTLTKGKPEVRDIYSRIKQSYVLERAASLEKLSEHPIAKAIVEKAVSLGIKRYKEVKGFKALRGRGVEGLIGRKKILIGNMTLMKERNIDVRGFENKIDEFESSGKTTMIVSENEDVLGIIAVADAVKPDSKDAVAKLNNKGYRTIMITGDNERTAKAIAKQLNIKEVIANVLPEDKAKKVEELQEHGMVAFVGDGINDAPALKQSNVGIAMGTGTDIAIESGDLVLAKSSVEGVEQAINLSKATFRKIKQNLFWAFAYNTIAIPIAIAGFVHPVIAEIAMAFSSVSVVVNANLLRRARIE